MFFEMSFEGLMPRVDRVSKTRFQEGFLKCGKGGSFGAKYQSPGSAFVFRGLFTISLNMFPSLL